jgi:hypothetical protein
MAEETEYDDIDGFDDIPAAETQSPSNPAGKSPDIGNKSTNESQSPSHAAGKSPDIESTDIPEEDSFVVPGQQPLGRQKSRKLIFNESTDQPSQQSIINDPPKDQKNIFSVSDVNEVSSDPMNLLQKLGDTPSKRRASLNSKKGDSLKNVFSIIEKDPNVYRRLNSIRKRKGQGREFDLSLLEGTPLALAEWSDSLLTTSAVYSDVRPDPEDRWVAALSGAVSPGPGSAVQAVTFHYSDGTQASFLTAGAAAPPRGDTSASGVEASGAVPNASQLGPEGSSLASANPPDASADSVAAAGRRPAFWFELHAGEYVLAVRYKHKRAALNMRVLGRCAPSLITCRIP